MTHAGVRVGVRALEVGIRVALETAVRTRVSTVSVDADGRITLTDPLTAALAGVHGDAVGTWTFGNLPRQAVTQDEIEWATAVLLGDWEAARCEVDRNDPRQRITSQTAP